MNIKDLALSSLYFFTKAILSFKDLSPSLHLRLCQFLEPRPLRALVLLPRGYFKSTICTVSYPLWLLAQNPNLRILLCSEREENASHFLSLIKQQLTSNSLLRTLFPHLALNPGETVWNTTQVLVKRDKMLKENSIECIGIGGTVVGRHYDVLIKDDITGPTSSDPANTRSILLWHQYSLSLLEDPTEMQDLHVGVRWSPTDYYSHLLSNPSYSSFVEGALNEQGESIFPERFPKEKLERIRADQGAEVFGSQYFLKPSSSEGMAFDFSKVQLYSNLSSEKIEEMYIVLALDPSIGSKPTSDRQAIVVVGKIGRDVYVLHAEGVRKSVSELTSCLLNVCRTYRPLKVIIESNAFQVLFSRIFQQEAQKQDVPVRVIEFKARRSKDLRIRSLEPLISSGRLYVPSSCTLLLEELRTYPDTKFDDLLDALSTAVSYLPSYPVGSSSDLEDEDEREEVWEEERDAITGY